MNNKKLLYISGVLAFLLLVGGYISYSVIQNKTEESITQRKSLFEDESGSVKVSADNQQISGNIFTLIKLGQNYICEFEYSDENHTTSGTVYVADKGKNFSGSFVATDADGIEMTSNVIVDGEYSYIWSSEMEQGIKTALTDDFVTSESLYEQDSTNPEYSSPLMLPDDTDMEFDCKPWKVDETRFTPPTDIEFLDFTDGFDYQNFIDSDLNTTSGDTVPSSEGLDVCSACDNAPNEQAQAQCKQVLGC